MPLKGRPPKKNADFLREAVRSVVSKKKESNEGDINIYITYNIYIGNSATHVEQRAEGGGQINKNVGTNANQGGQNAIDHSQSSNDQSNFADGNGRSGIAGNDNDEAGGQQGIKVRDSLVNRSIIGSTSEQGESLENTDEESV